MSACSNCQCCAEKTAQINKLTEEVARINEIAIRNVNATADKLATIKKLQDELKVVKGKLKKANSKINAAKPTGDRGRSQHRSKSRGKTIGTTAITEFRNEYFTGNDANLFEGFISDDSFATELNAMLKKYVHRKVARTDFKHRMCDYVEDKMLDILSHRYNHASEPQPLTVKEIVNKLSLTERMFDHEAVRDSRYGILNTVSPFNEWDDLLRGYVRRSADLVVDNAIAKLDLELYNSLPANSHARVAARRSKSRNAPRQQSTA